MADVMNETAQNLSDTAQNETAKIPATPEGMAVAYGSLVVMALVPIFFGSFRSVKFLREQKESGEKAETMTGRDAAMFPIIASCTLFGIYIFFKLFSKEYINMLLAVYFFFLGVLALSHILSPVLRGLMPRAFPNEDYHLVLTQGKDKKKEDLMNYEFDRVDLVTLALCAGIGVWYLTKKHWIANNLFGLAFSLNGVEFLQLNRISTGCILLGGLFLYDIFWVFGTEVMVTVAKSFDAPIKLVFPQDLLENGLNANNFAMLGLGDIVIPGIFIAMMLRFDVSINRNKRTYFYATFGAYVFGLLATIFVMHVFKHAQGSLSFLAYMYWAISKFPCPALLYLVPACIGTPLFVALIKGELKELFSYEDNPSTGETPSDSKDKDSGEVKANGPTEEKKDK